MTQLDERQIAPRLQPAGVAVLLVYGAKIHPPRDGHPGVEVTVDGHGTVLLTAVGYTDEGAANVAICKAAQTCLDADLIVSFAPARLGKYTRIVRRKA